MKKKIYHSLNEALKGKKIIRMAHTLEEGLEQTVLPIPQEIWYKYPTLDEDIIKKYVNYFRPFPNRDRDRQYTYDHVIWKMMAMRYIEKMEEEPIFFCFKNSTNLEEACEEFGFRQLMPDYKLFKDLQNKTRLGFYGIDKEHGEIPFIEANLSEVKYRDIKKELNGDFVIQFSFNPQGWNTSGGRDTYFVENEEDFQNAAQKNPHRVAKISKFIHGPSLVINCVATDKGTITTDPFIQAIGIPELAENKAMFCGCDYSHKKYFTKKVVEQIVKIAKNVGNTIYGKKYKGFFGIDFILDTKTETVYALEINPRMTASTNMLNFLYQKADLIPTIALHFSEHLDCTPESFSVEEYENELKGSHEGGTLYIRNREKKAVQINSAPKPGVYKITKQGVSFVKDAYHIGEVPKKNHFLLHQIHPLKRNVGPIETICKIQTLESVLEDCNVLTPKYKKVVNLVYEKFEFMPENTYDSSILYEPI